MPLLLVVNQISVGTNAFAMYPRLPDVVTVRNSYGRKVSRVTHLRSNGTARNLGYMSTAEHLANIAAAQSDLRTYHADKGDARDMTDAEANHLRTLINRTAVAKRTALRDGVKFSAIIDAQKGTK